MFSDYLAGKEYALKLYVLNLIPVLNCILDSRLSYIYAGTVYKYINMTELFNHGIYKTVNAFFC